MGPLTLHPNFSRKRKIIFQPIIFRFYVILQGCKSIFFFEKKTRQGTELYIRIHKGLRRVLPDPLKVHFEKPASDLPEDWLPGMDVPFKRVEWVGGLKNRWYQWNTVYLIGCVYIIQVQYIYIYNV